MAGDGSYQIKSCLLSTPTGGGGGFFLTVLLPSQGMTPESPAGSHEATSADLMKRTANMAETLRI